MGDPEFVLDFEEIYVIDSKTKSITRAKVLVINFVTFLILHIRWQHDSSLPFILFSMSFFLSKVDIFLLLDDALDSKGEDVSFYSKGEDVSLFLSLSLMQNLVQGSLT